MNKMDHKIGIIGLGYVGLPLAVEFAKKYKTFGFDINESRIIELREGYDRTLEIQKNKLLEVIKDCNQPIGLYCTSKISEIKDCNVFIVTVPTPVDKNNH